MSVISAPAFAETVMVPATQSAPVRAPAMSFKELDEQTKRYRFDEAISLQLNQYTAVGRIPLTPFQSYAASSVYVRSVAGVSVTFKF